MASDDDAAAGFTILLGELESLRADRDRLASLLEKLRQGIEQAHATGCCCQFKGHEEDCHIPILADLLTEMENK